jgi:hypothetical protein
VVLPNITLSSTATFCAFVRYSDNNGSGILPSGARILDWSSGSGSNGNLSVFMGNDLATRDLRFETRNRQGQDPNALIAPQALTLAVGFWAHVCASVDDVGSKRAYVNGVLVAGPTAPQAALLNATVRTTNFFGRSSNSSNAFFRGKRRSTQTVCVCVFVCVCVCKCSG